ncbi:MAG: hypothetical protein NT062_17525, partial [Proteobacteria bacterium]|nr:hypothetical protein [Pseudomonadota bacterium]
MLLASGAHDRARVAIDEQLASAPIHVGTLLATVELAARGRTPELATGLERLAVAVSEPELRSAVQVARAILALHHNAPAEAAGWFGRAAETDPGALAARLASIRHAAVHGEHASAAVALLDLAFNVEGEDPISAAALAVRVQRWAEGAGPLVGRETIAAAAQLAARAAPRDPLVARIATEMAVVADEPAIVIHAFARWARTKAAAPVERAYASARAAELDPTRLARLWTQVLDLDPGDDYAKAQLRASHL